MSEEILIGNFNWDEPEEIIEAIGGKTYFGKLRLYLSLQVQRFKTGQHFTLPGIWEYHFNEADNTSTPTGNLLPFKGMILGESKTHLHLVVAELLNKDHIPYQRIWRFNNWKDKDGDEIRPNAWEQYQFHEFKNLPQRDTLAVTGEIALKNPDDPKSWVHARYELTETGYTGQYEIKNYLANVVIYDSEQEWKKAEQEWRSQFSNGSNAQKNYSHYPQMWQSKPDALKKYVNKLHSEGKTHKAIALSAKLISEDGNPANNANGDEVNVVALLAELLDLPEPMVTL